MSRHSRNRSRSSREPRLPEEPDTSAPVGDVDLTNRAVKVYLVKMPDFLVDRFVPVSEDASNNLANRPIVGRLRVPEGGGSQTDGAGSKNNSAKIFINNAPSKKGAGSSANSKEAKGTVDEYELLFQPDEPTIYVFSGKPQGEDPEMRAEGQVSYLCTARPKLDRKYRSVNRFRTMNAEKKTRTTLTMDESSRRAADLALLKPIGMVETTKQREERKKSKEDARRHLDVPDAQWRNLAKVAVFRAFENQAYYSADQLAKDVDEPLSRLRSVINEVCIYNKSGPFSGKYELKDQLKTVKQRQQKEREIEEYKQQQVETLRRRRDERAERERVEGPPSKRSKSS